MSQQINLINFTLEKQRDLLSAEVMVRAVAGLVGLLVLVTLYVWVQTDKLAAEQVQWTKQAEQAKAVMTQTAQQFPARQPNPLLQAEIKSLEEKIGSRERVLAFVQQGALGRSQGFSGMMEAFARQGLNGLWLTGMEVSTAGEEMRIKGNAMSADLIPQYITRLSAEQALRGRNFSAFRVGQPKPVGNAALASGAAPQGQPAAVVSYVEFELSADKVADKAQAGFKPVAEVKR